MTTLPSHHWKLSQSQVRSIIAGAITVVITLNQNWSLITGIPGIHFPPIFTTIVQLGGVLITMFSRSLNRGDSGTGVGIAGTPRTAVK